MATIYTWSITGLKKAPSLNGLDDVVTGIRFKYKGVDSDGNEGVFNGAVPVGLPDSDSFTAISELTEAEIIEWAKANHPVDHMQMMITKIIEDKKVPKSDDYTPSWVSEENTSETP
tara:strand:- start:54 stop:401 length:348 start_codon:yes stop_codon:yes gene_type:complete